MPNPDFVALAKQSDYRYLCQSQVASYAGVDVTPSTMVVKNLRYMSAQLLSQLRQYRDPLVIIGAYYPVEAAKLLGMPRDNPHSQGKAIDIYSPTTPLEFLLEGLTSGNWPHFDRACIESYRSPYGGHIHLEVDFDCLPHKAVKMAVPPLSLTCALDNPKKRK